VREVLARSNIDRFSVAFISLIQCGKKSLGLAYSKEKENVRNDVCHVFIFAFKVSASAAALYPY